MAIVSQKMGSELGNQVIKNQINYNGGWKVKIVTTNEAKVIRIWGVQTTHSNLEETKGDIRESQCEDVINHKK
jgi:hypothetical protein